MRWSLPTSLKFLSILKNRWRVLPHNIPDDVEAYSKAAAQVRAGITSSIDPNYQGVVGATLDNVIQSYETKVFG